jgi:hypothetical protein
MEKENMKCMAGKMLKKREEAGQDTPAGRVL